MTTTEKALAELAKMTKEELRNTLVKSGIITKDGQLAEPYKADSKHWGHRT